MLKKNKKAERIAAFIFAICVAVITPVINIYAASSVFEGLTGIAKVVADDAGSQFDEVQSNMPAGLYSKFAGGASPSFYPERQVYPKNNLVAFKYLKADSTDEYQLWVVTWGFYNSSDELDVSINDDMYMCVDMRYSSSRGDYLSIIFASESKFEFTPCYIKTCGDINSSDCSFTNGSASWTPDYSEAYGMYMGVLEASFTDLYDVSVEQGDSLKFIYSQIPVYTDYDTFISDLTAGDMSNVSYTPASYYDYNDNLYLENFKIQIHDSNFYSKYYIRFSYDLPDSIKFASDFTEGHYMLKICNSLQWEGKLTSSTSVAINTTSNNFKDYSGGNYYDYIDLYKNPVGFDLYLDDLSSVSKFIDSWGLLDDAYKRKVIGVPDRFNITGLGIDGILGIEADSMQADISKVSLQIGIVHDSKAIGYVYDGQVNLLTNTGYVDTYVKDDSDEYVSQSSEDVADHYYTEVVTDAAGNYQYNYYYYGSDGSRSETDASGVVVSTGDVVQNNNVTIPDSINVTINGGSSSGVAADDIDFTIEDDDMSFSSLTDVLKSGFGLIDDIDTDVKGDGYTSLLEDLYPNMPKIYTTIPLLGISSVVAIAIIRAIIRR